MMTPADAALEYLPLARILARKACVVPDDIPDLTNEGALALMLAVEAYNAEGKPIDNPGGFARTAMWRGQQMFNYYTHGNRGCRILLYSDLAATASGGRMDRGADEDVCRATSILQTVSVVGDDDLFFQVLLREFFNELERIHGRDTRLVAENLAVPGQEAVLIAMEERAEKIVRFSADKPRSVRGIHHLRVTHNHIRQAFCMPPAVWTRHVESVRGFAREWFDVIQTADGHLRLA